MSSNLSISEWLLSSKLTPPIRIGCNWAQIRHQTGAVSAQLKPTPTQGARGSYFSDFARRFSAAFHSAASDRAAGEPGAISAIGSPVAAIRSIAAA